MPRRDRRAPPIAHPLTIADRYAVDRLLGQGGVGAVYAVTDKSTGAQLALKQLMPSANARVSGLFEREFRTLAGLSHPCIVSVYDYGVSDTGTYYTMELVDGRDLSANAPIPWRIACAYLRDAASILGLLHARRLLHRDISPRNLLLTTSGRLKLIDFGALADFGPASEVVGTPPFVPPEALNGLALEQGSDLFALGALGYWLITGANAFPARALDELPMLWAREPPPASARLRMSTRGDEIDAPPRQLDELLATLLRVDAHERITATSDLIDRLNAIAELASERSELAVQGYLQSKVFVGREPEKARVMEALADARSGRGKVLLIEAEPGMGRSRFMIRELYAADRANFYAGAHLALGALLVRRDDREGLSVAEKLEQFSPLYAMTADHLRTCYYAGQGDANNARVWRDKVEVHAVQLGSTWQAELWSPVDFVNIAWRLNDATVMKRVMQELERLSTDLPSLANQHHDARIGYLVLHGRFADAIELGKRCDKPPYNGWMRTRGALARAHNALSQHERARELCLSALAAAGPEDLEYVGMNLGVQTELALAEAGLGRTQAAHNQLQALLKRHERNHGAITLGSLHEARARVYMLERDFPSAREHVKRAATLYQSTAVVTLIGRARALALEILRAEEPEAESPERLEGERHQARSTRLVRSMLRKRAVGPDRLPGSLQIAVELCSAARGFLLMASDDTRVAAYVGNEPPSPEVVEWARQKAAHDDDDFATVMPDNAASPIHWQFKVFDELHYLTLPLWATRYGSAQIVAALALGFDNTDAKPPSASDLRVIASHLVAEDNW